MARVRFLGTAEAIAVEHLLSDLFHANTTVLAEVSADVLDKLVATLR